MYEAFFEMPDFSNLISRFNAFPANYFVDIDKLILKCIWKSKRPRKIELIFEEEEEGEGEEKGKNE